MMYQVLARASAEVAWGPYQAMTRDMRQALALVQQAKRAFAEVTVIQAETAMLLREQVQRLRIGEPSGYEVCPLPSLTATPLVSLVGATIESERWAIEQGPGGDHDVPYRFEASISPQTLARWAQLMSAAQGEDDETLAELASSAVRSEGDEGERALAAETVTIAPDAIRSERIGG